MSRDLEVCSVLETDSGLAMKANLQVVCCSYTVGRTFRYLAGRFDKSATGNDHPIYDKEVTGINMGKPGKTGQAGSPCAEGCRRHSLCTPINAS